MLKLETAHKLLNLRTPLVEREFIHILEASHIQDCSILSYREELSASARELRGELYCLPCHDKMGIPICSACHRPIEERIVTALGKHWHVEVRLFRDTSLYIHGRYRKFWVDGGILFPSMHPEFFSPSPFRRGNFSNKKILLP